VPETELKTASSDRSPLCVYGAMLSDIGKERSINEDYAAYVIPRPEDAQYCRGILALVADGIGGHAAGEVASALAAREVIRAYYDAEQPVEGALLAGFEAANDVIYSEGCRSVERRGMGTTCTAVAVREGRAYLAHVGDTRLYLLRSQDLRQLSEDHSLVMGLVRSGAITRQEADERSDRNVILRALGTRAEVEVQVCGEGLPLQAGDVLLLCSDGLTDLVDDDTIKSILLGHPPLEACWALIAAALDAGGHDNVSVGVFAFCSTAPGAARPVRITRSGSIDGIPT
jgi:serine/threonine protein phosphatase PrpC